MDDSENDLFLLRIAFKKAGFDCNLPEAHDGEQAIAYLKGESLYGNRLEYPLPSVVLLDINMPVINGFQVLEWLRDQPGLKRLTVFIMTASTRIEDSNRAADLGANSLLVKPATIENLVAMIKSLHGWMSYIQFPSLTAVATR